MIIVAFGCRVCNKFDWKDRNVPPLAKPEHVSYRGVDIGSCKGVMIPLFAEKEDSLGEK